MIVVIIIAAFTFGCLLFAVQASFGWMWIGFGCDAIQCDDVEMDDSDSGRGERRLEFGRRREIHLYCGPWDCQFRRSPITQSFVITFACKVKVPKEGNK